MTGRKKLDATTTHRPLSTQHSVMLTLCCVTHHYLRHKLWCFVLLSTMILATTTHLPLSTQQSQVVLFCNTVSVHYVHNTISFAIFNTSCWCIAIVVVSTKYWPLSIQHTTIWIFFAVHYLPLRFCKSTFHQPAWDIVNTSCAVLQYCFPIIFYNTVLQLRLCNSICHHRHEIVSTQQLACE